MKKIMATVLSLLVTVTAFAGQGGSFFLSDLKDILARQDVLWRQVESAFEIYPIGDATRIEWQENHELAGTRIGPYQLFAKPQGTSGPFIYEIVIETKRSFYDDAKRIVPLEKAVTMEEEITAIKIHPLEAAEYFSPDAD